MSKNESVRDDAQDVRFEVPKNRRPYSTIVKLFILTSSGGRYRGTGFLATLSSQLVIVTAGHCLRDGKSVDITWPDGNMQISVKKERFDWNEKLDYGMILLRDNDIPDSVKDHPILLVPYKPSIEDNHSLFVSGYPLTVHLTSNFKDQNATGQFGVFLIEPTIHKHGGHLLYKDPTSGGMSGGPVFYKCGHHNFAIGIHIQGFTSEKAMDSYLEVVCEDDDKEMGSSTKFSGLQPANDQDAELNSNNVALLLTEKITSKLREMLMSLRIKNQGPVPESNLTYGPGKAMDDGHCKKCLETDKWMKMAQEGLEGMKNLSLQQKKSS